MDEAIPTNHKNLADIVLTSPFTDAIYLISFYIDKMLQVLLFHVGICPCNLGCKALTLVYQFTVTASPHLGGTSLIGCGVLDQGDIGIADNAFVHLFIER